ncbi:MAG: mutT/nudix family protein [Osedax symbiont Rs1]|nr:MAG: mutT/nudix family protein [Osedax symbiont Rs1]
MLDLIKRRLDKYQPLTINRDLPEAGVLIAITDEAEPQVVLTKRASQLTSHSGEIAFPGGKRDATDIDILHTALREAHEEVDLNPEQVNLIGRLDDKVSLHQLKVSPCVGIISPSIVLTAHLAELDCVFKVPLSYFLDPANRCDHLSEYHAKAKYAPCYIFNGHLIWGLTSYILMEFLNVSLQAKIELQAQPGMKLAAKG